MPDESLRQPLPGGGKLDPMEILQDTLKEFTDDLGPYLLAGLGQFLVMVPLTLAFVFVMYFLVFATLFGGMFFGAFAAVAASETLGDEAAGAVFGLSYVGSLGLMFVVIMLAAMALGAIVAPLNASLVRRMAEHQRGGRKLDFSAYFSNASEDIPRVIMATVLVGLVTAVGFMFCYIPGIALAFLLMFATYLVILHKVSPVEAIRASAARFMAEPGPHAMFALLFMGVALVAANIPILGSMFITALHLRAYRVLFGDEEEPKLLEG